jgi:hypothetical protein
LIYVHILNRKTHDELSPLLPLHPRNRDLLPLRSHLPQRSRPIPCFSTPYSLFPTPCLFIGDIKCDSPSSERPAASVASSFP